ncbi:MAG: DUF4838 domain-containing protein [Lentisphaeria bacterium]
MIFKKMFHGAFLPLVLMAARSSAEAIPSFTLVKDRQPAATIVIAQQATRAAQLGAFELQAHVRDITGATLQIVNDTVTPTGPRILIGDSAQTRALGIRADSFKSQEYMIRFFPDTLVLIGRDKPDTGPVIYNPTTADPVRMFHSWPDIWDERGSLDACYEFLETFCQVRWFNATEFGTDCPHAATLTVASRMIRRQPTFRYRDALGGLGSVGDRYDELSQLWPAGSAGFNAWEAAAYPQMHARMSNPQGYCLAKRVAVRLFQLRHREGGVIARCNHSLYGYYDRFWEKNPAAPSLFVEKKPDWFAQGYQGRPPQMCYASDGLIRQLTEDARAYLDGKKTGGQLGIFWQPRPPNPFPIEPMDNGSFCKCARCQALLAKARPECSYFSNGQYSDYFFRFVNAVAQDVIQTNPQDELVTLAYGSHAAPPSFPLAKNVAVHFCFAWNRGPYQEEYAHEIGLLKQWAKQQRPLYLWLYDTFPKEVADAVKFHCWPGFFAHTLDQQMKLFHQLGVRGFFYCGYGQDLEAYLSYKLMDDVSLDVNTLMDDYFSRLYGPAGPPMRAFYRLVEETYCDPRNYDPADRHQTMPIAWGKLGTPERMAQLGEHMRQAKALAATDLQKKRVELFELSVWSYMVAGRQQYVERSAASIPSITVPRVAAAHGDSAKIDWSKAAVLGSWHAASQNAPAVRALSARALHDGQFLYLELTDPCPTMKLQTSATVFPYDDWEIFVAKDRALPYRQFAINPHGLLAATTNGEVNFRMNVPIMDHGIRVISDASAPDRWVTRAVLPFASLTPAGVAAGNPFYLNLARVTSPQLTGGAFGVDTWVAYSKLGDVDRLAQVMLAP